MKIYKLEIIFLLIKKKYLSIKSWIFPYYPTEEDVIKYFESGKSYFDNISEKELEEFKKKDENLPLGL